MITLVLQASQLVSPSIPKLQNHRLVSIAIGAVASNLVDLPEEIHARILLKGRLYCRSQPRETSCRRQRRYSDDGHTHCLQ